MFTQLCNLALVVEFARSRYWLKAFEGMTMKPQENTSSLDTLLLTVKMLKRQRTELSADERAERVSSVIERLASYHRAPATLPLQPIALSADDR
jgi:hypothetical protein